MGFLLLLVGLVVLVLVVVGLWMIAAYNGFVRLRQEVRNAWAGIEVQLKRRHDLIPNLVSTVKGYATHEKEALDRVITARARATSATGPADRIAAEGELGGALARLLAVSEAYPDLKANQNFLGLQQELAGTEGQVATVRTRYNDAVRRLNTVLQSFPALLIASLFGFKEEPFFEAPAGEREPPKVQF